MAKKAYPIPNLDNMTNEGLVEILQKYREQAAEAKFYDGFYAEIIKSRMAAENTDSYEGEKFILTKFKTFQERFDTKKMREVATTQPDTELGKMAKTALATWCKDVPMVQLKFSEKPESVSEVTKSTLAVTKDLT